LWVIFALLDPDPDPYSNYGSGSKGPIEYGSNTDPDPDPKHCLRDQFIDTPSTSRNSALFVT
jgi:hypothetical protein